MPLKIVEKKGVSIPTFFCDYCGEEIKTASDGNYHWKGNDAAAGGAALYYTHKRCCMSFEKSDPGGWGAMDLDCLPVYVTNSLKVDWKEANARVQLLGMIG